MFLLKATESGIDRVLTLSVNTIVLSDCFFKSVSFVWVLLVSIITTWARPTIETMHIKQKTERCFIGIKVKTEKIDWDGWNKIYKILVF